MPTKKKTPATPMAKVEPTGAALPRSKKTVEDVPKKKGTEPKKTLAKTAEPNRSEQTRRLRASLDLVKKGPVAIEDREANAKNWLEERMPFIGQDWDTIYDFSKAKKPIPQEFIFQALDFIWNYPSELYRIGMNHTGFARCCGIVIERACRKSMDCFNKAQRVLIYTAKSIDPDLAVELKIGMETLYKIYKPRKWHRGAEKNLLYMDTPWADNLNDELLKMPGDSQLTELVNLKKSLMKLKVKVLKADQASTPNAPHKVEERDVKSTEEIKLPMKSAVATTRRKAVTQKEAAIICERSVSAIRNWEKGVNTPEGWPGRDNVANLRMFADTHKQAAKLKKAVIGAIRTDDIDKFSHLAERDDDVEEERYRT